MDSQNKNTVFSHAASCARLNECTAAASVGELRALLKKSCACLLYTSDAADE